MARKKKILETVRRRPPFFWWILANLLAAAFAVVSWTTCLYIFNYPEKPTNYELLRKLKRLAPIAEFTPLDSPDGDPANPQVAFSKFISIENKALTALNTRLRRNYITNFKDPKFVTYAEGDFRVTHLRPLTPDDFFHPGVLVRLEPGRGDDVRLTRMTAEVDAGWGHFLAVRGDTAPLDWEGGWPARVTGDTTWEFATTEWDEGSVAFKWLLDDATWQSGDDQQVDAGGEHSSSPGFARGAR